MSRIIKSRVRAVSDAVGASLFGVGSDEDEGGGGGGCPEGAPPPPGLVYGSYLAANEREVGSFRVQIAVGGSAVKVTEIREKREKKERLLLVREKRGKVRGMSAASSRRAEFFLRSIDQRAVKRCDFITQTSGPDGLSQSDWPKVEQARRAWEKRFERKYGNHSACCIWKKEPHKDGRPHLHRLLLWMVEPPSLKEFREWDDLAWAESLGVLVHRVRCKIERMRTWAGVSCYLRKYIGKEVKDEELSDVFTGRCWGVRWAQNAPREVREEVVGPEVGKRYLRVLRKLQSRKREKFYRRSRADREWRRIHLLKAIVDANNNPMFRFGCLDEQVRWWRVECEQEIKRVRPSCLMRRRENLWSQDLKTGKLELSGEEVTSRAYGTHFVQAEQAEKLLAFIKRAARGLSPDGLGPVLACEARWAVIRQGEVRKREKPCPGESGTIIDDVPF